MFDFEFHPWLYCYIRLGREVPNMVDWLDVKKKKRALPGNFHYDFL